MAPHSSTLAWKTPWAEEPGRLQSMGSWRVAHDWGTSLSLFTFMPWRRNWQPTPVFLPGESQGRGSLVGCRLWGRAAEIKEARDHYLPAPRGGASQCLAFCRTLQFEFKIFVLKRAAFWVLCWLPSAFLPGLGTWGKPASLGRPERGERFWRGWGLS